MTPTLRVGSLSLASVALVVIGAGIALAAGTVGGKLSVTPTRVIVVNTASLDQTVRLSADPDDGTVLAPAVVDLAPGDAATVDVTGPATGDAVAAFSAAGITGEAVGVVLRAPFRPDAAPPAPVPWMTLLLLALVGGLVILGATRRYVLARERARAQGLAEYALLLALIAIVAIAALLFLGERIADQLSIVGNAV